MCKEKTLKICVAGLGIIGGSVCLALKRAGYGVDGWNRSEKALNYALKNGVIDGAVKSFEDYDVIFVALPPQATCDFLDRVKCRDGAYVYDVCGVKAPIRRAVYKKERNYFYLGTHPMAGKEISGVEAACAELFDYASLVVTPVPDTDAGALRTIGTLAADMGFARIVECSAEIHDRKIAYTSQLAHVVSNAYVKDEDIDCCLGFTGGSFQDMTRIAGVDENIWASLYLENAENVSGKIGSLIASLQEIKSAIDRGDGKKLAEVLKEGRLLFEKCKKIKQNESIFVRNLK